MLNGVLLLRCHSTFAIQHSTFLVPPYNNCPMHRALPGILALLLAACTTTQGPPTQPNDREWTLLGADYAWIESLRKAQTPPPPNASRKQMIEVTLAICKRSRRRSMLSWPRRPRTTSGRNTAAP